jgi:hypothetical protein
LDTLRAVAGHLNANNAAHHDALRLLDELRTIAEGIKGNTDSLVDAHSDKIPAPLRTRHGESAFVANLHDFFKIPLRGSEEPAGVYRARMATEIPVLYKDFLLYMVARGQTRFQGESWNFFKVLVSGVVMVATGVMLKPFVTYVWEIIWDKFDAWVASVTDAFDEKYLRPIGQTAQSALEYAQSAVQAVENLGVYLKGQYAILMQKIVIWLAKVQEVIDYMNNRIAEKSAEVLQSLGAAADTARNSAVDMAYRLTEMAKSVGMPRFLTTAQYHSVASFRRPRLACDVEPSWNVPRHVHRAPMATFT